MFKKTTFFLLVAIFAFSTAYVTAQSSTPDPAEQQNTMTNQQVSGVVEKVNMEKKTITIKDSVTNKKTDYTFNDSTLFSKGTESATASSLKKGDKVAVEIDAQNVIAAVRITPETQTPHK